MMSATYFGEITELDSRAVWYSDEEDDDEDEDEDVPTKRLSKSPIVPKSIDSMTHETFRSKIQTNFVRLTESIPMKFTTCVISLSSGSHINELKIPDSTPHRTIATFGPLGRALAFPINNPSEQLNESLLWLLFDSSHYYIVEQEVGYFVEHLRELLQNEFKLDPSSQIIILSGQFSTSEHLEYLNNISSQIVKPPFTGRHMMPPAIIRNQFESALFEQLTLSHKPALLVCLPDPKSYWFDCRENWPSIASEIVEHKLKDDSLEKTLIFT